jgi:hypothetical protein
VFCPLGNQEVSFEWRLSGATNNYIEAITLYQGINILEPRWLKELIVIGYSIIIIRFMHNVLLPMEI